MAKWSGSNPSGLFISLNASCYVGLPTFGRPANGTLSPTLPGPTSWSRVSACSTIMIGAGTQSISVIGSEAREWANS